MALGTIVSSYALHSCQTLHAASIVRSQAVDLARPPRSYAELTYFRRVSEAARVRNIFAELTTTSTPADSRGMGNLLAWSHQVLPEVMECE